MPIAREACAETPFVLGTVNYIDPGSPDAVMNDTEREHVRMNLLGHEVAIHDMRPLADQLSLDRNGFVLLREPTKVRDFFDPTQIRSIYYAEAAALVQRVTGAVHVEVFGEAVRNARDPKPMHPPVLNVHVDYDEASVRAKAADMLPSERRSLLDGRLQMVNLWRPITPIRSMPLALCDASSVKAGDLHPCELQKPRSGLPGATGLNVSHSPTHRWFYAPDMQPDEVLVFRLCDTRPGTPQWTAHTSFVDPTTLPDAPGRQSIEVRTLAFFGSP